MEKPLLEVSSLGVSFRAAGRVSEPVRNVSFSIPPRGRTALVGESGCGKSLTALSLARLPPLDRAQCSGTVVFRGAKRRFSGNAGDPALAALRGRGVSYVFQNPSEALNPVMRIGAQIEEALPPGLSRAQRRERAVSLLDRTGLPDPARAAAAHPCELSGGQCQRCALAMALAAGPDLLVADEPTTALDVTTQKLVLDLIDSLADETGMAVLLITHNLALVAGRTDEVNVMYAGAIVESGPVEEVLSHPRHPYTRGLLAAVPALDAPAASPLRDIPGTVPPPHDWPAGCAFHPRCPHATERCKKETPALERAGDRAKCACFLRETAEEAGSAV